MLSAWHHFQTLNRSSVPFSFMFPNSFSLSSLSTQEQPVFYWNGQEAGISVAVMGLHALCCSIQYKDREDRCKQTRKRIHAYIGTPVQDFMWEQSGVEGVSEAEKEGQRREMKQDEENQDEKWDKKKLWE